MASSAHRYQVREIPVAGTSGWGDWGGSGALASGTTAWPELIDLCSCGPCSSGGALADAIPDRGVAHDAVQGPDAVPPADLLALVVRAPAVGDADLVNAPPAGGDLGGDLGLEPEAVLLDVDGLDDLAPEDLEAGLHVGEVQVGEHVRGQREEPVAEGVPEVEDTVRPSGLEPGAEDHVGLAVHERGQQQAVLGWVVLEV